MYSQANRPNTTMKEFIWLEVQQLFNIDLSLNYFLNPNCPNII